MYGNLGGSTTVSIGVGNFIFRNVIVTGFWCASHLCLRIASNRGAALGSWMRSSAVQLQALNEMKQADCSLERKLSAACRLNVWLNQLGPAKVETLGKVMDLLAQGVIVPHSGKRSST